MILILFIELISVVLFAEKSLLSIASADRKPKVLDKATQVNQDQAELGSML